jgi:hypothetical protein
MSEPSISFEIGGVLREASLEADETISAAAHRRGLTPAS